MKTIIFSLTAIIIAGCNAAIPSNPQTVWDQQGFYLPIVDLDSHTDMQVIIDREKGQYLGHPTTHLLDDGKTILIVYPKGHGRGPIVYKRSIDGGKTWSDRLPTPDTWATSREVPTLYPTVDAGGKERILMFTGVAEKNRLAITEDNGRTWSQLRDIPNQPGGIVVMSDLIKLNTGPGRYMATYHVRDRKERGYMILYICYTEDGGLTWTDPVTIHRSNTKHLCEGGIVRSPDGKEIALLLRENARNHNSQIMFTTDEGKTCTKPIGMPGALCGDRHQAIYLNDGRLLIQFRDRTPGKRQNNKRSPTEGDWTGWVGTWDDLKNGRQGQYRIRFKDNKHGWDTTYPAAELLPDGTLVCTTYGHWDKNEKPYIMCLRFKIDQLDKMAMDIVKGNQPEITNDMGKDVYLYNPDNPELIHKSVR